VTGDGLAPFTSTVRTWFAGRFPHPTGIQALAWPRIAAGEHVLVTAPTGTGKTLTGFLWPLDRLLSGAWEGGGLRVLYVSPLKALNADIERNLREPLAGLEAAFRAAGQEPPAVRVGVRSGDSTAAERERIRRRPPEILITTPESLNLLLLSKSAPRIFEGLRLLILDEIHAVVGSKRGTHLVTAVERLTRHAGEFQRVAISATVRPLETVARFVGGHELVRRGGSEARFRPREIGIVRAEEAKRYELRVRALAEPELPVDRAPDADDAWRRLADDLAERIREARSTIVFTNSRRTAEKMTRFVNEAARAELAWSHHGSLARDLRTAVERRLKAGELPAIVATSSLELGIDVGELDRVVLLQTPRSLASTAQRIGRAGHRAGEVSRALFYPTHPRDFLDAAVAVAAVSAGEIEPVRPVKAPLDLLAQTLLGMVATESWSLDSLFDFVRTADPYRDLSRKRFDLVIEMLGGRYASVRIEELKPRVRIDRVAGTIEGRPGLVPLLARGGGTIPDRGYYRLVVEGSGASLGELDEEFVWERAAGDQFVFGAQAWRVVSIGLHEVTVAPARGGAPLPPFWRADAQDRGAYLSERIARFLEWADGKVGDPELERVLERDHGFEPEAARRLAGALEEERRALGVALPHRRHVVVEEVPEHGDDGRRQAIVYTFWGGTVNRPAAMALAALWEESEGSGLEAYADDDAILLILPEGVDARDLLARLDPDRIEELLRRRLESGGYFGAHFRRNAQRALLLPRAGPRRRTPLWVSRQNARKLLDAVAESDDFPLVLETWRTCLVDEFELDALRERLAEVARGEIRVSRVRTERPSPFAANLVWRRTNEQMYEDDAAESRRGSRLRDDLLREVALDAEARPRIPKALVERYRRTAQRLQPGYAPLDAEELHDWLVERLWIPKEEWAALLEAIGAELGSRGAAEQLVGELGDRLVRLDPGGFSEAVAASETALDVADCPPLAARFGESDSGADGSTEDAAWVGALARRLSHWLRFAGPLRVDELIRLSGIDAGVVERAVESELREGRMVRGDLTVGSTQGDELAARSTFETLLRWRRAEARPTRRAVPLPRWPAWLARRQGLIEKGSDPEALRSALERLFGYPAPAALWETEILPARLDPYLPAWLDALEAETDLGWLGCGARRATFALESERDLFPPPREAPEEDGSADELPSMIEDVLAGARGGLELGEVVDAVGRPSAEVQEALWRLTWSGRVACDSIRPLRQAVLSRFRVRPLRSEVPAGQTGRRSGFRRWARSRSFDGRWRRLDAGAGKGIDALRDEALRRERARVLAERYGILFRELLARELPELSWGRLARTLRALELGGELVAGSFLEGVPGPQFALPSAIESLDERSPEGAIWWQSALDPASPCALGLPALETLDLPERRAGNLLVWRGEELLLVARAGGAELEIRVPPGDPVVPALLEPLRVALTRAVAPRSSIEVQRIDGGPAATSPHLNAFREFARSRTAAGVRLRRRYGGS